MEQDGQCRDFLQRTIQLQMYHHIGAIFRIRVAIVTMTAIMALVFQYCQCKGYTCFKDKTLTLNTGEQRLSVVPQWNKYWKWHGCHLDFFSCDCENDNASSWRNIWEQDKDGADNGKMLRALHSKMLSINRHAASAPKGSKNSKEEL